MSSTLYTADPSTITNKFIHLTNSSIQKKSKHGQADTIANAGDAHAGGTKTSLTYMWQRLRKSGWDTDKLWASIRSLIVKSLVCVDDVIPYQVWGLRDDNWGMKLLITRSPTPSRCSAMTCF